ncbi:hypothetical protein OAG1_06980 [Agarivorans sp. OAG1]|uniref:DUF6884 domain-containing protein n=1 Tax=unclassified Agarivorans TaxID=2636026 RepID=UPI002B283E96|nr:hypothetical protein OAG1_06980 [Agarivorans sp. OAG1]
MPDIHLLVPCSAQKTNPASKKMCISTHKTPDLNQSLNAWSIAFNQTPERYSSSSLYTGQAFKFAKKLAKENEFKLSILSAGFGLVESNTNLPCYNATFASNVNRVPSPHPVWWSSVCDTHLPGISISKYVAAHPEERFVFCLSKEYINAVQEDLRHTLDSQALNSEKIIIITSSIPRTLQPFKSQFVKVSRNILNHPKAKECGLALTDRNIIYIATYLFVEQLRLTKASFNGIIQTLTKDLRSLSAPKRPIRVKRDNSFILTFIEKELDKHHDASQTLLFKLYKEEGNACADTRFRSLYHKIKLTKAQRD